MINKKALTLFLFLLCINSNATEIKKIFDFLSNEEISYADNYKELNNVKINFSDEVDVFYPSFTGLKNMQIQSKINNNIQNIAFNQLESDSFLVNLFINMRENLAVFFQINGKEEDQLGIYDINIQKFTPSVSDVNVRFISFFKSVVCVEFDFTYKAAYQNYNIDEKFHYIEIYYFNTITGNMYRSKDVFNKSFEQKINDVLKQRAQQSITQAIISNDNDDYDREKTASNDNKNEQTINNFLWINQGYLLPTAFSFAYYIPDFKPSTLQTRGNSMCLYFTLNELKNYLNPKGPYAALIKYSLPDFTNLQNQNKPYINSYQYTSDKPIDVIEVDSIHIVRKIHKISKTRYQVITDKDGTKKKTNISKKVIEYQEDGNLQSIKQYDVDDKLLNKTMFYYVNNNLVKKESYDKENLISIEEFVYDKYNNLLEHKIINADFSPKIESQNYYYAENFFLKEISSFRTITYTSHFKYFINNKGLIDNDICTHGAMLSENRNYYKYDANNRLLAIIDEKQKALNYVYDNQGKLLSCSVGAFFEYTYDSNNLIKEVRSSNNTKFIRETEYNDRKDPIRVEENRIEYNECRATIVCEFNYEYK